jgi:iron complex outermembrane recepter protein
MIRGIGLIVMYLLSGFCLAQDQKSVSEKDFLADMPMVLSVSRLPQRLDETPGAVTILDRRTIRMSGARDVADLLRLVPGFQVSNSFEGNAPQGSYHGNWGDFANHVQVMVDGRSVYSLNLQGSTGPGLQTVAIEDIERIEVLRGSNSAAYGARAFLGTINIITRDTLDTQGVQAQVGAGSNGIQDTLARLGWGDDTARYRLGVDLRADNGLSGASGPNQVRRVNFRSDLRLGAVDQVELRAGQSVVESGVGFADQEGNLPRTRSMETSFLQLDWRRNLGPDQDLALQLSHTSERGTDKFIHGSTQVSGLLIDFGGRASNNNLSLQHTFRSGPDLRVVWGGELRREGIVSKPVFNTDAEFVTDFSRLFGNAEWRLHRDWVLNAGGMVEQSSLSGERFSPRLMLNWHFAEGQTLRYGESKAYRPPSQFEKFANVRYYTPVGNPIPAGTLLDSTTVARGNVRAEGIVAKEIGYLGDFPDIGLNLDVRVFQEEIRDFIRTSNYALPDSGLLDQNAVDFINGENFFNRGVEYQLKWQPWKGGHLIFNQSYVDSSWTDNGTFRAKPFSSMGLMFMQSLPGGVDFSVMHSQSDSTSFAGSSSLVVAAMSRTDLRLAKQLRLGSKRGEVSFVVQNLGPTYPDFLPNTQFRQQAFVMLKLEN